ncbi:MAG: hypothetical protein H6707_18085 [Deltaproteobacteria bacterium]|nr:hypothetical protein [Deltaproteobacteria bacterium]
MCVDRGFVLLVACVVGCAPTAGPAVALDSGLGVQDSGVIAPDSVMVPDAETDAGTSADGSGPTAPDDAGLPDGPSVNAFQGPLRAVMLGTLTTVAAASRGRTGLTIGGRASSGAIVDVDGFRFKPPSGVSWGWVGRVVDGSGVSWVIPAKAPSYASVDHVAMHGDESVVAGTFVDKVTLDGTTVLAGKGLSLFISRLSPTGKVKWILALPANDFIVLRALVADGAGNAYGAIEFQGELTVDGRTVISPNGKRDVLLVKLDTLGRFVWAKQYGNSSDDYAVDLEMDAKGGLHYLGEYQGGAVSYSGHKVSADDVKREIIYGAINAATGDFVRIKSFGGPGDQFADSLAMLSDRPVIAAQLEGGKLTLASGVVYDSKTRSVASIIELDAQLALDKVHVIERPYDAVTLAARGNRLYVAGHFLGQVNWHGLSQPSPANSRGIYFASIEAGKPTLVVPQHPKGLAVVRQATSSAQGDPIWIGRFSTDFSVGGYTVRTAKPHYNGAFVWQQP